MSGLSALAQTFEANSKQQASATAQAVQSALDQHEQTLIEQLRSSERTLNAAIQAREKSLSALLSTTEASTRATVLNSWKWLAGSLAAVALVSGGALWWTGQQIEQNLSQIEQQKATMARAQALGVEFVSNQDGQFIVLPRGMTPATGWTFDNRRRQAIKLEK